MFNKNILLPFTLLAFLFITSCSNDKSKAESNNEKPIAVTLADASSNTQQAVLASGQVEAIQSANISTRVMGRITNIFVKVGDVVKKGQLLASISDEDIKAKRAQINSSIHEAEASYNAAQKDLDRFNNLYKQQSATAKELDNVTLQYKSAKARVDAAKEMRNEVNAMLSYSSLTAPFSGVVTQKLVEVGSIANPGMPILTIEQTGILQVAASVAESDISNIQVGDIAQMQIKSTGKMFQGKITQLNPSSKFTGGQFIIKISIPETEKKDVYSGMFVTVTIPTKKIKQHTEENIMIPISAIVNRDELTGIYTVSTNNTALLRWIRLGKTFNDKVEVLSGLSKDEKFIIKSESKLYNGVKVKVN